MKTHTSGYGIGQVQYELLSCGTNETPLQRFVRVFVRVFVGMFLVQRNLYSHTK